MRWCWFLWFLACDSDKGLTVYNSPPTIELTSHTETAAISATDQHVFGAVTDLNDLPDELTLRWLIDDNQVCTDSIVAADGSIECTFTGDISMNRLVVEVRDPANAAASDELELIWENAPPTAEIVSHLSGATFDIGDQVRFAGQVSDADHEAIQLGLMWALDGVVQCNASAAADGSTYCDIELQEGASEIVLQVTDPMSASSDARLSIEMLRLQSPVVSITEPTSGAEYPLDHQPELIALITDVEQPPSALMLALNSDVDGPQQVGVPDSDGQLVAPLYLTQGVHVISLSATDDDGLVGMDSLQITVGPANLAPQCSILSPTSGQVLVYGDPAQFEGTVLDADQSAVDPVVTLHSDLDGVLFSGNPSNNGVVSVSINALSPGAHQLSLEATDEWGLGCRSVRTVRVGSAPTISITEPLSGVTFPQAAVLLAAQVSDPEDAAAQLSVSWSSNVDGGLLTVSPDASGFVSQSIVGLSGGQHTLTAVVTDSDGMTSLDQSIITINEPPSIPVIASSPATVTTVDDIQISALSTDPEGDSLTYDYSWAQNGVTSSLASALLPSHLTENGDLWEVTVFANDGYQDGPSATYSVAVNNTPPLITVTSISPTPALSNSLMTCTTAASDIDNDPLSSTYLWTIGGTSYAGQQLPLSPFIASPGEVLSCTATVDDGMATTSDTVQVVVANQNPLILTAAISPNLLISGDSSQCSATASDADAQNVALSYAWLLNGQSVGSGASLVVPAASSGDVLTCQITATDTSGGQSTDSVSVVIANSPPTISSISVLPATITAATSQITCVATAADVDNDPVAIAYLWMKNGLQIAMGNTYSGPFSAGEQLNCVATPSDPYGLGSSQSTQVFVGNTAPTLSSVILNNPAPTTNEVLTVIGTPVDPDLGQTVQLQVDWHVIDPNTGNDQLVLSGFSTQLSGAQYFDKGDLVYAVVNAFDGVASSPQVQSSTAQVVNSVPGPPVIAVAPSPAALGDTLSCSIVMAGVDPDNDPLTHNMLWTAPNGAITMGNGTSHSVAASSLGLWTCSVQSSDGTAFSAGVSATTQVNPQVACSTHSDCNGLYCALWRSDGQYHCSDQCVSDADCSGGETCVKLPGSGNAHFCEPIPQATFPAGAACVADSDCSSGICPAGVCEGQCGTESDCAAGESCHIIGNPSAGIVLESCGQNLPSLADIGQSCKHGNLASGSNCDTGHCDIHQYDFIFNNADAYCRPLCNKESDCDLSGQYPEVCDVVFAASTPTSAGLSIQPNSITPSDTATACYEPWNVGSGAVGDICLSNGDCATNKCFNIMSGSPQRYCSAFCETDLDCGAGTVCGTGSLNLVNEWMLDHSGYSASTLQGMSTLLKLCVFP